MKIWYRHWYDFGLIPAGIAVILMIIFWNDMEVLQRLAVLNFVALCIHQFEEYSRPGGMAYILNQMQKQLNMPIFHFKEDTKTDRYPLNQFNAMLGNCFVVYVVYLLPIFFSNVFIFGFAPIVFGLVFQVVMHCILANIKMGCLYNPGMGAVLLGHVPIGIYYFWYINVNGLATVENIVAGMFYFIATIIIFMLLTYKLFAKQENDYPFSKEEIDRGEKFARKHFKKYNL